MKTASALLAGLLLVPLLAARALPPGTDTGEGGTTGTTKDGTSADPVAGVDTSDPNSGTDTTVTEPSPDEMPQDLEAQDLEIFRELNRQLAPYKEKWKTATEGEKPGIRAKIISLYSGRITTGLSPYGQKMVEAEVDRLTAAGPPVVVPEGPTDPNKLPAADTSNRPAVNTTDSSNANPGTTPPVSFRDVVNMALWDSRKKLAENEMRDRPDSSSGYSKQGQNMVLERDYRGAFPVLDKAIKLGANDSKTFAAYGTAAHHLGDYQLAIKAGSQALKVDPGNQVAFAIVKLSEGRAQAASLPSAMRGGAFTGLGDSPADAESSVQLGAVAALDRGGASRREALTAAEQRSLVFAKEAAAALSMRDYLRAADAASRAIDTNSNNAQAWNYRAIANNKLDRFSDAVQDASFALKLVPENTPALQTRSWAQSKMKKYKEALADANRIIERDPNNAFAFQNRAFALAGLGDRVGMLESLKRSAELDGRFQDRYEAALQAPDSDDVLFLFDEDAAKAAPAAKAPAPKRRLGTLVLSVASGGVLLALGLLHFFSASWREKVRTTMRRALGTGAAAGGPAEQDGAGAFWSKYRVVREVGLGGMGVVYEGVDTSLDRPVAIKKMRDEIRLDRRERERFLQEARMVAALRHPNIVEIYSIVEDGGDIYLVFEFASGKTLAAHMSERGTLPFDQALAVLKDACAAVEYAHRRKIIHRDIKPSNIMVTDDGSAKVMDFGVARQAKDAANKTMTNTVVGTPPYMAPESEQGTVRPESDVYALGVVFYEMLAGSLPFAGQGAGMLLNKLNGRFTPLSEATSQKLPDGINDVMAKVLSPDPDKRYRTPTELLAALERLK
ncbi:MAG: protein kinase [Elusimicrobia bacterium]|nr:protein kinase [Elusimicrobiota bacterium]